METQDINAIKKRLETKIRLSQNELKEFTREKLELSERQIKSDIGRLDMRMRSIENLISKRITVFILGAIFGALLAFMGMFIMRVGS